MPEACSKVFELNQSHPARVSSHSLHLCIHRLGVAYGQTLDATDETLEESGLRNAQLLANWVEEEE